MRYTAGCIDTTISRPVSRCGRSTNEACMHSGLPTLCAEGARTTMPLHGRRARTTRCSSEHALQSSPSLSGRSICGPSGLRYPHPSQYEMGTGIVIRSLPFSDGCATYGRLAFVRYSNQCRDERTAQVGADRSHTDTGACSVVSRGSDVSSVRPPQVVRPDRFPVSTTAETSA